MNRANIPFSDRVPYAFTTWSLHPTHEIPVPDGSVAIVTTSCENVMIANPALFKTCESNLNKVYVSSGCVIIIHMSDLQVTEVDLYSAVDDDMAFLRWMDWHINDKIAQIKRTIQLLRK